MLAIKIIGTWLLVIVLIVLLVAWAHNYDLSHDPEEDEGEADD